MKMVLSWAAPASGHAARATVSRPSASVVNFLMVASSPSMRERPQPQLLLGDLPQPGQAAGLDDQKKDDEPAEGHQLDLFLERRGHADAQQVGQVGQEDGDQDD